MIRRFPPSRAGRLWLVRRLDLASRGVEVLDQKRQTLLREQKRLAEEAARAADAWERTSAAAALWSRRAITSAGERRVRLATQYAAGRCDVTIAWRNALGTRFPAGAAVELGDAPDLVALGGGSVVALAARAHADAVVAAADHAAARAAHDAIRRELAATTRRQRAIKERWIPEHRAALRSLELTLDEREREDIGRARWALEQQETRALSRGG